MQYCRLYLILYFLGQLYYSTAYSQNKLNLCQNAFLFEFEEYAVVDTILICKNTDGIPTGYTTDLNMAVCNDGLCARLLLKVNWDLAGSYLGYDTIQGNRLTKFDHKPFTGTDYKRLDEILRDKNSILGTIDHEELVDKRVKIKATTVDAVTGATSKLIKNSVVEGAVYSTYALWHLLYSPVIDSMRLYTRNMFSMEIASQLLSSENYDSQLFALKLMSEADYQASFPLIIQVIKKSVPFIKAYIIGKIPLPFADEDKNMELISVFSILDSYSKGIFVDRIIENKEVAETFLPLLTTHVNLLDTKQFDKCLAAFQKYGIDVPEKFRKI